MATHLVHVTTVPESLYFVSGQVGFMKANGLHVSGISSPGPYLDRFGAEESIDTIPAEMPRRITPIKDIGALVTIWKHLRRLRPDIVHAHTPKGGLLGMLAAWLARVPVRIYHMHGLPYLTAVGWKRQLLMWSEFVACRMSNRVLCVSRSVRTVAVEAGLCDPDKIVVLLEGSCNGVDANARFNPDRLDGQVRLQVREQYGIPQDAMVIGFVGRLVKAKGIVELSEAWANIRDQYPATHLLLVGPVETGDPVPPEVLRRLHEDPRAHLIGEEWDVPPLYRAMDLLVLPTYREGFPIVLLEAAAMRLPIVATQVPGCVDAVRDGETGTLVPAQNSDQLAVAIARYLEDRVLGRMHGLAARNRVLREFSEHAMWKAVYEEYQRLLEAQGLRVSTLGLASSNQPATSSCSSGTKLDGQGNVAQG
jgi:glycosyltransferase involved in cell wall biosynthesis